MIYNIITTQLLALLVLAFLQPNKIRMFMAVFFVGIIFLHEALFADLGLWIDYDDVWIAALYYGAAAFFALSIVFIISDLRKPNNTGLAIQRICIASMLVNLAGFVLWYFEFKETAYELGFVLIYSWAIVVLIRRNPTDVRRPPVYRWMFGDIGHGIQGTAIVHRHKGPA